MMKTGFAAMALAVSSFQFCAIIAPGQARAGLGTALTAAAAPAALAFRQAADEARDALLPPLRKGFAHVATELEDLLERDRPEPALIAKGADLSGTGFVTARLDHALLQGAVLDEADFTKSYLAEARLDGVSAKGAEFAEAVLDRASFRGASLQGARFGGADLFGTRLDGAHLEGADLSGANGLTQGQLDKACGDGSTRLPGGLAIPPCPEALGKL